MDNNDQLLSPLLELYTYSQPSREGKYIVELYDKKRYTTIVNNMINIDENMTKLKVTLNNNQQLPNEILAIYPKVTTINIHSQMTMITAENEYDR